MRGRKTVHLQGRSRSSVRRTISDGKLCRSSRVVAYPRSSYADDADGLCFYQRNTRNKYIKNYCFDFDFGPPWGKCNVTMTAVTGHLTGTDFGSGYKNWSYPPPVTLFGAPITTFVSHVCSSILVPVADGMDGWLKYRPGQERHSKEHRRASKVLQGSFRLDRL